MEKKSNSLITRDVKRFYEKNPFPGLTYKLPLKRSRQFTARLKPHGKVLCPGCGTGHGVVAAGVVRPDLKLFGLDLSKPSLDIARQLSEMHGVELKLLQCDYMKPLPYSIRFQYIILSGTLHHTADPVLALNNLVNYLEDDGLIFIHLYGERYHRRRFEIIEMLDLLQQVGDKKSIDERFALFKAMKEKQEEKGVKDFVMDISIRKIWRLIYKACYQIKLKSRKESAPPSWEANFQKPTTIWIDQFTNPNEKSYNIWETKKLLESANLELVEMISTGRGNIKDLPGLWQSFYKNLDIWSQCCLMELWYPKTGAIRLWAKKRIDS